MADSEDKLVIRPRKRRSTRGLRNSEDRGAIPGGLDHGERPVYDDTQKHSAEAYEGKAKLVPVAEKNHLGYFSTFALILNKTVGTGIYVSPAVVLTVTGSKGVSLAFWIAGCLVTWAGLYIYLEYGMRWPVTGGELYYIDNVWTRPFRLFTYIFSSMFILINGIQANALTFGKEIILAANGGNSAGIDTRLQKFLAVVIITLVCQLQAYSRSIYVRLSNVLAIYKLVLLFVIMVCGFVALGGHRVRGSNMIETPYWKGNLDNAFDGRSKGLFEYSLALLNVMRAFLGYENANFVLHEVRQGPSGDERRYFRRAVKISVSTICFFYMMVNVAFFAACTKEEIINSPDTLAIFFRKIFGASEGANTSSAVFVCLSAVGALMSLTFANVRVKQEIARMGLLPLSEFWAQTSHRRTPARALVLHWIFSVICISITPLHNADGFLIMSTFYSYIHTYISILLGVALLAAPFLKSFSYSDREDVKFRPQSTTLGWWLLAPLAVIYVLANGFVLILSWFPGDQPIHTDPTLPTLPYYTGPVAGVAVIAFGIFWYLWNEKLLPFAGYHCEVVEHTEYDKYWEIDVPQVFFYRRPEGLSLRIFQLSKPIYDWVAKKLDD